MTCLGRIRHLGRASVERARGITSHGGVGWTRVARAYTVKLASFGGFAVVFVLLPSVALAADPPCSSVFPSAGPAGIDLKGACTANEVVQNYVAPHPGSEMLWAAGIILAVSWMAAVVLYAAWRWLARREARSFASTAPVSFWLCEGCRSFNSADATSCYSCRLPRPAHPRTVDATVPPVWDQRFGRPPDL